MTVHALRAAVLPGRTAEIAAVEQALTAARDGRSAAIVVRGVAGIGKSALLRHAIAAAPDMRVLSGTGVESESTLPFAGLHLLLKDSMAGVDELPDAQAAALRAALGTAPATQSPTDRFLVGLAVLTLLAELATDRPVLCLLDDAHWADRASTDVLLFVARRLAAEGVVMIFAARQGHAPTFPAADIDELVLHRLDDDAARAVLLSCAPDLPRHVHDKLREEAAGNPLALIELAAAHRAGRITSYPLGPPDAGRGGSRPTGGRVEQEFAARIEALPQRARTMVLIAAADGTCDTSVVLAAARRLGCTIEDLEAAQQAQLLMFSNGCLRFSHPLIRAAAYGTASVLRKQEAHRALVDVLDDRTDPDRRAWHRAAASLGPDEDVAKALDRSAKRARERGSPDAAAAASERAAALSNDARRRGRRLAAAAAAAADAGQPQWASMLAARAATHLTDPVELAELALINAVLAMESHRPEDAYPHLLDAAAGVADKDPELASAQLMWMIEAAWAARDRTGIDMAVEAAGRLRLPGAEYVMALAKVAAGQLGDDDALLGSAAALRALDQCGAGDPRTAVTLANWHLALGDHGAAHRLADHAERVARTNGLVAVLPGALAVLATTRWHLGSRRDAAAAAHEGERLARDIGQHQSIGALTDALAHLAAVVGEEVDADADPAVRGLLELGLGRFEAAADRLLHVAESTGGRHVLPDLVEAAMRVGRHELARAATDRFVHWATHTEQPWARAVGLRCRALVACAVAQEKAQPLYAEAVALHRSDGGRPFERARTELLQGEWLRRARRRSAARAPLRAALETFEKLGATPWAARARAELRATGETRAQAPPGPDALTDLTPQELQVVRLAAAGLTNRDIGAQLFLSPRTVGYHLHKAFPKLGVSSRAQLPQLDLPA